VPSSGAPPAAATSTAVCSAPSSSTSAARSTRASTRPGSRFADAKGFRTDVAREIKELGVPIVRYPGGNFVSGYHWLDGVGPRAERPVVLDRAWNSLETNQFGTNEFVEWCAMVGAEPLLGMNFGTGSVEMAVAYVEYCNVARGTRWSELRRAHGHDRPHKVRYW
jgi:alpha-L-arabinofuranosidase